MTLSGGVLLSRISGLGTSSRSESGPSTNRLKRRLGEPGGPAESAPPRAVRPRLVDRLTDTRPPIVVVGSADRPIDLTLDDDDDTEEVTCSSRSTASSTSSSCSSSTSTSPCPSGCSNTDDDEGTTAPSPPILTPDEIEAILIPAKARREAKCRAIIDSLSARPLPGRMVHPLPPRPLPARTRGRGRRLRRRPSPSPPTDDDEDDGDDDDARAEWGLKPPVIVGGGIILDDAEMPGFDLGTTTPVVLAEASWDDPLPAVLAGNPPAERGRADVPAQSTAWKAEASGSDGSTDPRRAEMVSIGEGSEPPSDEVDAFLSALEAVISGTNT